MANPWIPVPAYQQMLNPTPPTPIPTSLAGGASWVSGIMQGGGFPAIGVGATMAQAGTITIQRYLDKLGQIPVGAPISATLVSATANWATVNDGVPWVSFQVTIANTSGSVGALSNVGILLGRTV